MRKGRLKIAAGLMAVLLMGGATAEASGATPRQGDGRGLLKPPTEQPAGQGMKLTLKRNASGAGGAVTYTCDDAAMPFECDFTFDTSAKKVEISNLAGIINTSGGQIETPNTITADYDNGVITIPCATTGKEAGATLLGKSNGGDVYLQVGTKDWDDFGIFRVITNPEPELKLYVSEDNSTIETRLADGISIGGVYNISDFGWVCFGTCDNNVTFTAQNAPGGEILEYTYSCENANLPFECDFTFDPEGKTVSISNLAGIINTTGGQIQTPYTVRGTFEGGVIRIACGGLKGDDNATALGMSSSGDVYLQVGTKDWDDFGIFRVITNPQPELRLYVSEDYSTIETRIEDGQTIGGVYNLSDFGWVCFGTCDNNVVFNRKANEVQGSKFDYLYTCKATDPSITFKSRFAFDLEAETVTISNFGGFINQQGSDFTPEEITVAFKNGEFTLPCELPDVNPANSTKLGKTFGMDAYLQTGTFAWDDNFFTMIIDPQKELTFKVNSDYSRITAQISPEQTVAGVIDYTDLYDVWACTGRCTGGMVFERISETEDWSVDASELNFGSTTPSNPVTKTVTLQSKGGADVAWTASIEGEMFEVSPASGILEALDSSRLKVVYNPSEAGEHTGTLTIKGDEISYTIDLSGSAKEADTDFSGIITQGDPATVAWTNNSANPWEYVDGKAVMSNPTGRDESVLSFTISGNKPHRLTYDIQMNTDFNDTFSMRVNGKNLFAYHHNLTYTESRIVPAGQPVEWVVETGNYPEGGVRISNLRIEETATWEGLSPDGSVSPLMTDGYINIDGSAQATGKSATMMLDLNPKEASNLSFDYETGKSAMDILVGETVVEHIEAGKKGTYHYDMDGATFLSIKMTSGEADATSYGNIKNLRLTKGAYFGGPRTYNAVVYSYTDKEGSYSKTDGLVYNYPVEITLTSGGKAIFKGLLPQHEDYVKVFDVEGYITGDEIHIPTYKNINLATLYAYDETSMENYPIYYDRRYWLVAGEIGGDMIPTRTDNELILKISDDRKVLTPTSDFGVWGTWSWEDQGIFTFYRSDSQFVVQGDEAEITTTAKAVDFGEIMANGYEYKQSFTVLSTGTDCEFSAVAGNDEFEISPSTGVIKAGETQTFTVSFSTLEPGLRESEITIYSEGNDIELPLKADVKAIPDYASIVTEGKELIEFDAKVEYPWILTEAGAQSTNDGIHNSESTLKLKFEVPEGKTGIFTLDGAYCFEPIHDGFLIRANGQLLYADHYHNESINTSYPLESGTYNIELVHSKDSEDQYWMPYDHSIVSAISLRLSDSKAFATYTGDFFPRTVGVGEVVSDVVTIENFSDGEMRVISVDGTGGFGGVAPEGAKAERKYDTLEIPITFVAAQAGNYEGIVTVHTTVGDVEIPVKATADYVKYIGANEGGNLAAPYITALLQYGERNVGSTMWYPAAVMQELTGRDIESLTFFSSSLPDYSLTCPDVKAEVGETEETNITKMFDGLNEVMSGEMVDLDYWQHTIPFDEPYHYEGGNFVFQLSTAALENYGGHQKVQISYEHTRSLGGITIISLNGETADNPQKTVPVMMVTYTGDESGVGAVTADLDEITDVQYYSIDGIRLKSPVKGLNVVVTMFKNGEKRSAVMMK